MHKLGILISGRGSNMTAIHQNTQSGQLNAQIAVVISNKPDAEGLVFARENGIPTHVFEPKNYTDRDAYEHDVVSCLQSLDVDLVVLAGYMKLVGDPMLKAYEGRMVNIHPSLLPSFKGLNAQQQALEYGVKITGCTAHYVIRDVDAGPIILQSAVPVLDDDTDDSLSARILDKEHEVFSKAIQVALNQLT
ncbi:phosphoribosylglycinamide formyltransferase [Candidatus Marinamargulisbacteria bacterium SCGC AG-343-K17]|nr:phosphoribosylglycinamide formyltransferase [Candidatus Marinamargulisbacteria bacterium SCGC AG-343-K17]